MYVETGSVSAVYKFLKENKIKNTGDRYFTKSTLAYVLRNKIYIGKIKHNDKIYDGIHEPLISEELFNIAQSIHKKLVKKYKVYKNHTFGGMVECGECGSKMTSCFTNKKTKGKRKLKRYFYYRCTITLKKDWDSCKLKQVNADKLEAFIVENLQRIVKDDSYLENLVLRLNTDEKVQKKADSKSASAGRIISETENEYSVKNVKYTVEEVLKYISESQDTEAKINLKNSYRISNTQKTK